MKITNEQKQHLIDMMKLDEEDGIYEEPNQALKDAAERLKGKELFKESNDRARKVLSEIKSLPIQETTLEEAMVDYSNDATQQLAFLNGAKWQQERSYSEEEVVQLLDALWTELDIWYNKKDDEQFNLIRWFYDSGLFKERKI